MTEGTAVKEGNIKNIWKSRRIALEIASESTLLACG